MERIKIFSGYILICLIWGSTWLGIKFSLSDFPPLFAAAWRFILAAVFILFFVGIFGLRFHTDRNALKVYAVLTLFSFAIPFPLVYWAEQTVASGLGAILFATFPFWIIIFAHFSYKEPIGPYKVIGTFLGFAGIVLIFAHDLTSSNSNSIIGILAILLAAAIQGFSSVYVKKFAHNINPLSMNFFPLLFGGIIIQIASLIFEDYSSLKFTTLDVGAVFYMALFGTVATFTTYYWLMKRIDVVILSLSTFISPIIAVFIGWLVLNETFSQNIYIASVMVLAGVLISNFAGLKKYLPH
jgi:drug/metabolite transporter (DMT)-like permease